MKISEWDQTLFDLKYSAPLKHILREKKIVIRNLRKRNIIGPQIKNLSIPYLKLPK